MFLDVLRRRNPSLIEHAIALHQSGKLPANAYVIDLEAVEDNAHAIAGAAERLGLTTLAMTKQMGRNPSFCRALKRGGIAKVVAVDMECARAADHAGLEIRHIGHLSRVPKYEAQAAAICTRLLDRLGFRESQRGRLRLAEAQARATSPCAYPGGGRHFYRGHEGGFPASEVATVAEALDRTPGGRFAGVTTFPALLFDPATRKVTPTPNLETLCRAAEALAKSGRRDIEVNAPGTAPPSRSTRLRRLALRKSNLDMD